MCWASRPWPGSSTEGLRRRFGSAEISRLHQHFAAPAVDCGGLRRWAPMEPSDSRRLKRFSLKSLLSSCRRPTGCCARLSAVLSFRCWPLACRPDRVNAIVSRLGGCVIRVNVQADGFDLTAQIRGFVETKCWRHLVDSTPASRWSKCISGLSEDAPRRTKQCAVSS